MFSASKCDNSQKMIESPPFKTGEIICEGWESEKNGSGMNLFIPITAGKEIELDSAYFRGNIVKLEKVKRDSYLVYIGRFKNTSLSNRDIIMHSDPKKEVGNVPPLPKKKMPFELKENEAVISFIENNKEKYYKLKNIKVSPTVKN